MATEASGITSTPIQKKAELSSVNANAISGPSSAQVLPTELLQHIIDDVDFTSPEGRASLVALSYACHASAVLCQRRLFSCVCIEVKIGREGNFAEFFEGDEDLGSKFLAVIEGSPHLAAYVRSFTVALANPQKPSRPGAPLKPMRSMHLILPRLQNLRMLEFAGGWSWQWRTLDIPPRILDLFTDILRGQRGLDVHAFRDFPISLFQEISALESLSISSLIFDKPVSLTSRARLKSLEVLHPEVGLKYKPEVLISWVGTNSPFDINNLVSLRLVLFDFRGLPELLSPCSQTLEELDVSIRSPTYARSKFLYDSDVPMLEPQHPIPNLGSLHKLRRLTILGTIFSKGHYGYFDTNLPFILAMLATLPLKSPTTLKLTLDIKIFDMPLNLLILIASSKRIFKALNEEHLRSRFAAIRMRFQRHPSILRNTSDTTSVDVLDCNEDLRDLRELGILTYSTVRTESSTI